MMTESNVKVCKDCKHYRFDVLSTSFDPEKMPKFFPHVCEHPRVIEPRIDLITGQRFSPPIRECHRERSAGKCGLEGNHWEAVDD